MAMAIKQIWQWIKQAMVAVGSKRRLSMAEAEAKEWKQDAQRLLQELRRAEDRLESTIENVQASIDRESKRCSDLYGRAEGLVERHEDVEEKLTSELKIYKEVVIPTWALNLESLRSQQEADIALQAQRKAAYTLPGHKREDDQ